MKAKLNKILALTLTLCISFVMLAGCAAPGGNTNQRIVCLAPSSVEVVYELGLGDSIVGWSQYTDYPVEVESKKGWVPYEEYQFVSIEDELAKDVAVVSGFTDYNKDIIKELNPTLILACESMQGGMAEELKAEGYNVLWHSPETLEDVFTMMTEIGEATGTKATADKLVAGYRKELAEIEKITSTLPKVKTYIEIAHFGPWATGSGSPMDQIITYAGGVNIFEDVKNMAFETTNASIIGRNPDVILTPLWPRAGREEVTTVREIVMREGYESISAVMNDRVYHYDSSLFKRPGPRQVTAVKKLAYLLHPYYFENPENSVSPWELGKIDETYKAPKSLE